MKKLTNNETTFHEDIYSIPCKDCNKHYIGETERNLEKRIYERKRSIKTNDDQNALFYHVLELKHNQIYIYIYIYIYIWLLTFAA